MLVPPRFVYRPLSLLLIGPRISANPLVLQVLSYAKKTSTPLHEVLSSSNLTVLKTFDEPHVTISSDHELTKQNEFDSNSTLEETLENPSEVTCNLLKKSRGRPKRAPQKVSSKRSEENSTCYGTTTLKLKSKEMESPVFSDANDSSLNDEFSTTWPQITNLSIQVIKLYKVYGEHHILLIRVGSFFELYGGQAQKWSGPLGLKLTKRVRRSLGGKKQINSVDVT